MLFGSIFTIPVWPSFYLISTTDAGLVDSLRKSLDLVSSHLGYLLVGYLLIGLATATIGIGLPAILNTTLAGTAADFPATIAAAALMVTAWWSTVIAYATLLATIEETTSPFRF